MSRGGNRQDDRGASGQRGSPAFARQGDRSPSVGAAARRTRPVYRDAALERPIGAYPSANTGLLYDRMADIWSATYNEKPAAGAKDTFHKQIRDQHARATEVAGLIVSLHQRRAALWLAAKAVPLRLVLAAPLVSGLGMSHALEVGFSWDRNLGVPYLPASGLKGAARAYAEQWELRALATGSPERAAMAADIARVFGPSGEPGRTAPESGSVIFHALYPERRPELRLDVLNPHFSGYYQRGEAPGDWSAPEPVFFLTVKSGEAFLTAVQPRPGAAEGDADKAAGWLREALSLTGVGGKTAMGYGVFQPS